MIDVLIDDFCNEMSHMRFYLEAASSIAGPERLEYREFFLEEAKSEMGHVDEFRNLIFSLSIRHGVYVNFSGKNNINEKLSNCDIPKNIIAKNDVSSLLQQAINLEDEVVNNYVKRIEDTQLLQESNVDKVKVDGKYIEIFLEDQIMHSRSDANEMLRMLRKF